MWMLSIFVTDLFPHSFPSCSFSLSVHSQRTIMSVTTDADLSVHPSSVVTVISFLRRLTLRGALVL